MALFVWWFESYIVSLSSKQNNMEKQFKAILINPTGKPSITEVLVSGLESMQTHIKGSIEGVGYIKPNGVVGDYDDDFIYVNEEGLYDYKTDFVKIPGYAQEFYRGCMLITGSDGEGGEADVKISIEDAKKFISFIRKEDIKSHI